MEDDDLEVLRQAALKTLGANKKRPGRSSGVGTPSRIKTNGNLIEIQPSDDLAAEDAGELNSEDYVVEEFVIEGSDVSIHSSECDEVIEEVIMSDVDDVEESVTDGKESDQLTEDNSGVKPSSPRSVSSNRQNTSDGDESDAVSIKSSYSLIMDDDEEFQSVEAKFLSKKIQKDNVGPGNNSTISAGQGIRLGSKRSRSPIELPSRTRNLGRRSRSRERDANTRSTNRKSRSRSRSPPGRRRIHSPLQRGMRRPHRTNSPERCRRRRSRSRSPARASSPPRPKVSNRRPKSRSKTPPSLSERAKPRPTATGTSNKSPTEEKQPEKIQKTVRNNNIPPEQLERLEKRRRKFEGESVVPSKNHVIKIAASAKDKDSSGSSNLTSSKPSTTPSSSRKPVIPKEKPPKTSKRSVELVKESDLRASSTDKSSSSSSSKDKSSGDNQEDLRARLIKKKMEKQLQHGPSSASSSPSSSNGVLSSVVVPVNKGSHRIFSQALKNSQLLEAAANESSGAIKSTSSKSDRPSTPSNTSQKSSKQRSQPSESRSSSSRKPSSGSAGRGTSSSSSSTSKSKGTSRGSKRVVSVTYS